RYDPDAIQMIAETFDVGHERVLGYAQGKSVYDRLSRRKLIGKVTERFVGGDGVRSNQRDPLAAFSGDFGIPAPQFDVDHVRVAGEHPVGQRLEVDRQVLL